MKNKLLHFITFFVATLYVSSTFALNYTYTTLIFKDYEDLRPIVRSSVKESQKYKLPKEEKHVISPLKKTLRMLLSRPDNDGLIKKLTPDLIGELRSLGFFSKVIGELISDGTADIRNTSLSPKVRTTALIMMNNLLMLVRPLTLSKKPLALHVCKLADEKIEVPLEVKLDAKLTTMFNSTSPSTLAVKIMKWYAERKGVDVQANSKGCPFSKRKA